MNQMFFADILTPLASFFLKVVLEATGEAQLREIAAAMEAAGVVHKLWVEQPEDFVTALATAPALKGRVAPLVKKLKLCKG